MEDYPNLILIPDNDETLEEIIEDYTSMIEYNLKNGVSVKGFLEMYAEEVAHWAFKQHLITSARQTLANLEEIIEVENDFDDEDIGE